MSHNPDHSFFGKPTPRQQTAGAPLAEPAWRPEAVAIAPPIAVRRPKEASVGDWVGGVLISLLFPIIGVIVGIIYAAKGNEKKPVGLMCIALSLIAFGLYYSMFATGQQSTGYGP